jgi:hypothetical protein
MTAPEACADVGALKTGGAVASNGNAAADRGVLKPATAPNKDVAGDEALCDAAGACLKLNAPKPAATWQPMKVNRLLRV